MKPPKTYRLYWEDFPIGHVMAFGARASNPNVGLMPSRWELRNQHGVVVLTMEGWAMFRHRSSATIAG